MNKACPFCESEETLLETPYVELKENGEYAPTTRYCCSAQAKNHEFTRKRYTNLYEKPDSEEASEW